MEIKKEGSKKNQAPSQFVRKPDGSIEVVSADKDVDNLLNELYRPQKHRNYKFSTLDTKFSHLKKLKIADFKQKRFYFSAGAILILIIGLTIVSNIPNKEVNKSTQILGTSNTQSKKTLPREKPSFKILYPSGSDKEIVGDLVRSTPDNVAPGYRYFDEVGGITISVTQQQLPTSFKQSTDTKVATMAKDFQATNVIKINSDIIYHGLSEKTKQQSLIFTKNGLLIFIISQSKLSDDEWVGYITNLK